ncbi:tRNA (adenosine(37)-N6)-threonylcarbamoyltransferase complex ATPase subunit type 1 TsaE [Planctomycetota bacterium]
MADFEILTKSPGETIALGRRIGSLLQGGEVFAIQGTLGTGKTHFIKGIAAGAGACDTQEINSPTFVLVNEYEGRLTVYHLDAYRLDSVADFEGLGFDDLLSPDAVVLIEWADRVASALKGVGCIEVQLSHAGETTRRLAFNKAPDDWDVT